VYLSSTDPSVPDRVRQFAQGLCVLTKDNGKETKSLFSGRMAFSTQTDPSRKKG